MPIVGWEYDGSAPLLLQDKIPVFLIRIRMDPGFFADPDPDSREEKNFDQDPEKKLDPKHGKIQKLALKTNLSFFFSIYLNQKKPYIKPKRKIKQTFKELLTTTKQVFLYWMGTFQVKNRRPSPHNVENKFLIKFGKRGLEPWSKTQENTPSTMSAQK